MRTLLLLLSLGLVGCSRLDPVEEISVDKSTPPTTAVSYQPPADDWPGWRGPLRNGVATSTTAPTRWSEAENIAWKSPVPGRGHASPVVVGDLVVLSTAEEKEERQLMIAFDRATGDAAWRTVLHEGKFPSQGELHQKGTNANGTVAFDGEHLFIAHLNGGEIVASAVTLAGEIAWQTTLGPFQSKFGYAPSPVLHGGYALFAADHRDGGFLAAVDRTTGDIAWRKQRPAESSYSSPVVAKVAGRDQLLISGANTIRSYDPNNGDQLWSAAGCSEATCGTLVWNDGTVFASGGYPGKQTVAVRADGSGEVLWDNNLKVYEPSMLVVGDSLYATDDRGAAYCWDAATGEQQWRKRLGGSFSASPVLCDGKIYAVNASGTTFIFEATPDGYQEIAQNQLGEDTYASPAICGGRVYLRVGSGDGDARQEFLYCIAADAPQTGD